MSRNKHPRTFVVEFKPAMGELAWRRQGEPSWVVTEERGFNKHARRLDLGYRPAHVGLRFEVTALPGTTLWARVEGLDDFLLCEVLGAGDHEPLRRGFR